MFVLLLGCLFSLVFVVLVGFDVGILIVLVACFCLVDLSWWFGLRLLIVYVLVEFGCLV